jgi:hypothetical protein
MPDAFTLDEAHDLVEGRGERREVVVEVRP